jgi:phosphoribosylanthranilate isomerase
MSDSKQVSKVEIKICGLTDVDNACAVAVLGVSYLGINCWDKSKRYAAPEIALQIARAVRSVRKADSPRLVGLFVDQGIDEVLATVVSLQLDIVQLHGDESLEYVHALRQGLRRRQHSAVKIWRAIPITEAFTLTDAGPWTGVVDGILLDTPAVGKGGSGVTFDWARVGDTSSWLDCKRILAGGLNADNVAAAIVATKPNVVDVASGVELRAGIKDLAKVAAFVSATRNVSSRK